MEFPQSWTQVPEGAPSLIVRVWSFPSWPEDPNGWDAWAPGPCVRTTAHETAQVWASHRGCWGHAHLVLSGEQGPSPRLWWRHEATGIAGGAGPCIDMLNPRLRIAGMACAAGGSRHECMRPSGRLLQTNLGDGRTRKCVSVSTFWTAAYEVHDLKLADPRSVVTHRFSWAQWSKGCKTLTLYRLEEPALSHPSPTGLRSLPARQDLNLEGRRANWIA